MRWLLGRHAKRRTGALDDQPVERPEVVLDRQHLDAPEAISTG